MKILVLPGDGIGPEIAQATLTVLDRANAKFKLGLEWDQREMGLTTLKKVGSTLPDDVMEAARKAPGIILGPVDHLIYPSREKGGINPSGEFRVKLDLFANIRPAISRMGMGLTGKPIDLVIFRECTEGFYSDRNMFMGKAEFMPTEDMALAGGEDYELLLAVRPSRHAAFERACARAGERVTRIGRLGGDGLRFLRGTHPIPPPPGFDHFRREIHSKAGKRARPRI